MNRIDTFLDMVIKQGGSDLHLISGNVPRIRINGDVFPVKYRVLTEEETSDLIFSIMNDNEKNEFDIDHVTDFSYSPSAEFRFRVNVFKHYDGIGAVLRAIPAEIQSLNSLGLPPVLKNLARLKKGLILVTGPTGSGKSTTLSAIVDFINTERKGHIITIEDPIEFVHRDKNCLISQREIGAHTKTFASALRSALREDPDVILVGEMRDLETISLAVTAAEMGILVLATLHTNGAAATVNRIINVFPAGEEPYIRTMLSTSLCGVISQVLIRRADQKGRVAALEIMINNAAVSNLIREGKIDQIDTVIQSGAMQGMQSFDNSLRKLIDSTTITKNEAYLHARNKADFEMDSESDDDDDEEEN
ncbi:MAG: type IV pilus twitching motility protein PilT [Gammaproteobacteria bacterium]